MKDVLSEQSEDSVPTRRINMAFVDNLTEDSLIRWIKNNANHEIIVVNIPIIYGNIFA